MSEFTDTPASLYPSLLLPPPSAATPLFSLSFCRCTQYLLMESPIVPPYQRAALEWRASGRAIPRASIHYAEHSLRDNLFSSSYTYAIFGGESMTLVRRNLFPDWTLSIASWLRFFLKPCKRLFGRRRIFIYILCHFTIKKRSIHLQLFQTEATETNVKRIADKS